MATASVGTASVAVVQDVKPGPTAHQAEISTLPASLPSKLHGQMAWTGQDFGNESAYIYPLNVGDRAEVAAALQHFKGLELDGEAVNCDNFPLPNLGPKLDALSRDVHHGKGFCVIRGIKPAEYSIEDLTQVYLGVQSYIADQRGRQDSKGNVLVHIVADSSSETRVHHHRHSNTSISFHNEESGDVVSWLTRSTAAAGGKCIIASAYTIYNVLAAERPDLVRALARADWPFALPYFQCRPVIFYEDGKLIMNFGRAPLLGNAAHPRPAHLPSLTARQVEALDAVEAIARATQMEFQTQAGDMHFINNLAVLHRRESFVDGELLSERRHLVRMRLRSSSLGWKLPLELQHEWAAAFHDDESAPDRVFHLEPMPEHYFPLRKYPN